MDPDGEEPADLRGVVSDAEGDVVPPSEQADQQLMREQETEGEQQQHHGLVPPHHHHLAMFPPVWPGIQQQQQQQQQQPTNSQQQQALAMAHHYYESRMRDHAAAYASAAAGAAWAAAQIAVQAAEFVASANDPNNPQAMPPVLPMPPAVAAAGGGGAAAAAMYYPDDTNAAAAAAAAGSTGNMVYPSVAAVVPPGVDPSQFYYNNMFSEYPEQPQHHHQQQQQPQYQEEHSDGYYEYRNHRNTRRKRSQRRPPDGISIPQQPSPPNNSNNNNARRRLRDGGDSSNSSCCSGSLGTSVTSFNSDHQNNNNNRRAFRKGSNENGSGGGGGGGGNSGRGHYHRYKKKQRQPRDDTNLLGKTAVSALYEWCHKRRMQQPSFVLLYPKDDLEIKVGTDFETAVYLEDGEWGRGIGRTKGSSKQDAARKALLALFPGVVFDPESGILVKVPTMEEDGSQNNTKNDPNNNTNFPRRAGSGQNEEMEDLAPHLAQRLAIASSGRDEDCDQNMSQPAPQDSNERSSQQQRYSSNNKLKRAWNVYPGTTTSTGTSEEDDENAYYVSRGASVCSVLLHAMVQIDDRVPEAPNYSFEVSKPPTANAQMKRKGPASTSSASAIVIHRGSFTCKATLKVLRKPSRPLLHTEHKQEDTASGGVNTAAETGIQEEEKDTVVDSSKEKRKRMGQLKDDHAGSEAGANILENSEREPSNNNGDEEEESNPQTVEVLEAVGVAGTKREAKHTASAKLLAMLFPECETMVEVKAAAEATRERYAASKAMKQQSNRRFTDSSSSSGRRHDSRGGRGQKSKYARLSRSSSGAVDLRAFYMADDPALPDHFMGKLHSILGQKSPLRKLSSVSCQVAGLEKLNLNQEPGDETDTATAGSAPSGHISKSSKAESPVSLSQSNVNEQVAQDSICRQLSSRQKQLEEHVDKALQSLNEHDEEGRTLSDELTVDDVGRLVLRRAETDDLDRIRKLLPNEATTSNALCLSPVSLLGASPHERTERYDMNTQNHALRLWSSSTFVLLLCRAIAAFEDPPLGCAVLTLGFSAEKGRLIRIAQIGSEPHLPPERFLECLDAFAACMDCRLERNDCDQKDVDSKRPCGVRLRLNRDDLTSIVESHLGGPGGGRAATNDSKSSARSHGSNISSGPLQSVLEESEGGEDSDKSSEAATKLKGRDKPSKRSRVQ